MLKNRLIKLEQQRWNNSRTRVVFASEINGVMTIPELNFKGSPEEGKKFIDQVVIPGVLIVMFVGSEDANM